MHLLTCLEKIFRSKTGIILLILVSSCILVACNSDSQSSSSVKATFTGTVETVNEYGGMMVHIEESTGTKLLGSVSVGIPEDITEKFNAGDKVKIGFDGMTMETAPVMVQAITVEKID